MENSIEIVIKVLIKDYITLVNLKSISFIMNLII